MWGRWGTHTPQGRKKFRILRNVKHPKAPQPPKKFRILRNVKSPDTNPKKERAPENRKALGTWVKGALANDRELGQQKPIDNYMVLEYHQKYGIAIGTPHGMKTQRPPAKDQTPHFVVTVSGGYFRKDGNNKSIKSYTHKVRVPVSVFGSISKKEFDPETGTYHWKEQTRQVPIEEAGVMATILKSGILQTKIKKNDPSFYLLRTYEIQSMEPSHPNLRVPLSPYTMNLNELRDYITVNQFPITLPLFSSVQELRQALINYIEDPNHYETYEVGYKRRNALKSAFAREISTLEMEFEDDEGTGAGESETTISDL